jgi:hypothetical protein
MASRRIYLHIGAGIIVQRLAGLGVQARCPVQLIHIFAELNAAVVGAFADPGVRARLADLGQEIFPPNQQTPGSILKGTKLADLPVGAEAKDMAAKQLTRLAARKAATKAAKAAPPTAVKPPPVLTPPIETPLKTPEQLRDRVRASLLRSCRRPSSSSSSTCKPPGRSASRCRRRSA